MKKLTEITRELTSEFIEDSLDDFVDTLGFKIKCFNNIGGNKWGSNLYMPLLIDGQFNVFSYSPSIEHNYVGHIVILEKQIEPFQRAGDSEYIKVDNAVKQLQRILSNCNVYYIINQTINGISNRNLDTHPNIEVVIAIVDRSKKISDKSISFYNETKTKVVNILASSRLRRYYHTKYENGVLSLLVHYYYSEIKDDERWKELISQLEKSLKDENLKYEKIVSSENNIPNVKSVNIYQ